MWAQKQRHVSLRSEDPPQPPLPFPKGCGPAQASSTEKLGMENTRGDPGSRRPIRCVMRYEPRHLSWFVFTMNPVSAHLTPLPRTKRHPEMTATPRHCDDRLRHRREGSITARRIRQHRATLNLNDNTVEQRRQRHVTAAIAMSNGGDNNNGVKCE